MKCQACEKNESVGVCCMPGVPMSVSYCKECLEADNHPMWALIANTACCGGLDHCAQWWKDMVMTSLNYQGKTLEWFKEEVAKDIERIDKI